MGNETKGPKDFLPDTDLTKLTPEELLQWALSAQEKLVGNKKPESRQQASAKPTQVSELDPNRPLPNPEAWAPIVEKLTTFQLVMPQKYFIETNAQSNMLLRGTILHSLKTSFINTKDRTRYVDSDFTVANGLEYAAQKVFPQAVDTKGEFSDGQLLTWMQQNKSGSYSIVLYGQFRDPHEMGDRRISVWGGMRVDTPDLPTARLIFDQVRQFPTVTINSLTTQLWHKVDPDTDFYQLKPMDNARILAKDLTR